MSDSLRPHGLQHAQASLSFTISWSLLRFTSIESVMSSNHLILFSFYRQSFPASGSFPMSLLFASGGQSIGASASVLPINIQSLFPLGLTGLTSLLSKRHSRVFSSTTFQMHQFISAQPSLQRRQWQPTPVLLPGKSHGWRSLVGCSPWGR